MPLKICVCTTYPAEAEPRALRHAETLASIPGIEVTFVDSRAWSSPQSKLTQGMGWERICTRTNHVADRSDKPVKWLWGKAIQKKARIQFRTCSILHSSFMGSVSEGMERLLRKIRADVYYAHNIDCLLPAAHAAEHHKAKLFFDSMEYHADMDHSQSRLEKQYILAVQSAYLYKCQLVTAASPQIAEALHHEYQIPMPISLYNAAKVCDVDHVKKPKDTQLYWRNGTIGLGSRGLQDAITALSSLPKSITLHLQGRLQAVGSESVNRLIRHVGVQGRVVFHEPYEPSVAVSMAAQHTIGLCLEHPNIRNHELTVSNKMFDYLMAGLPVIASDLPGLRQVICRSKAGVLFKGGDPKSLWDAVLRLHEDPKATAELARNARVFAQDEGNRDVEMQKLVKAFMDLQLM